MHGTRGILPSSLFVTFDKSLKACGFLRLLPDVPCRLEVLYYYGNPNTTVCVSVIGFPLHNNSCNFSVLAESHHSPHIIAKGSAPSLFLLCTFSSLENVLMLSQFVPAHESAHPGFRLKP